MVQLPASVPCTTTGTSRDFGRRSCSPVVLVVPSSKYMTASFPAVKPPTLQLAYLMILLVDGDAFAFADM